VEAVELGDQGRLWQVTYLTAGKFTIQALAGAIVYCADSPAPPPCGCYTYRDWQNVEQRTSR